MTTIREVTSVLEEFAPLAYQESYDNSGLQVGNPSQEVKGVLCTIDVTLDVLEEAINLGANLIITHHPVIFGNLKSLTGKSLTEQVVIKAIENNLAIYAAHTNLDNVIAGVNHIISNKLNLKNQQILQPTRGLLQKLVCFVPIKQADSVREAMFQAGAGNIGNYDSCSYNISGEGTFRGNDNSEPFAGEPGKLHTEKEIRIETIVPKTQIYQVIKAMITAHPYEEVAYDIYPLDNEFESIGAGMIGELDEALTHEQFMQLLKKQFATPAIRYAGKEQQKYKRIAVCGGSGSFLLGQAIRKNADVFITGDVKYHQFFETENRILFCDIGHFESEQFTKEIFSSLLTKKFSTFAVHLSEIVTNPIKYFV